MLRLPADFWRARSDAGRQEVCGFLVDTHRQLSFRRLENLGGEGEFWIDIHEVQRVDRDIARSDGRITALVHCHSYSDRSSSSDRKLAAQSPWPLFIITPHGDARLVEP
jgi:proteasome lid subunit RPN8/RPN11